MNGILLFSMMLNLLLIGLGLWSVNKLGGFKYLKHRFNNQDMNAMKMHRQNLMSELSHSKGGLVMLGDSHSEYGEWNELLQGFEVKNRGIAGDGTEGVLNRLQSVIALEPDVLCLMIGVNDLMFIKVDEILVNYKRITKRLKSNLPNARIIVQSVLPVNDNIRILPFSNDSIIRLNRGIEEICIDNALEFLDLYPHFVDKEGVLKGEFTKDGVHLDAPGYLLWRDLLLAELKK